MQTKNIPTIQLILSKNFFAAWRLCARPLIRVICVICGSSPYPGPKTTKSDKASPQKENYCQFTIPPQHQRSNPNQRLKHPIPHRNLPVLNPHLICQQLINMPSMRRHQNTHCARNSSHATPNLHPSIHPTIPAEASHPNHPISSAACPPPSVFCP